jgi:recombination protein RecR
MNVKFRNTIKLIQKLPGVGPRQATRFILALLQKDEAELHELGHAISNLKKEIRFCNQCFNISETDLCHVCSDKKRDASKLLVVEKVTDLDSIERSGVYKGLYHVLGGAISPLDGLTQDRLRFRELNARVADLCDSKGLELIIATNPNASGETTSLYIRELFASADWQKKGVSITRLGRGLSSGSNLEYADEITLKNALESRK